MSYKGIERRYGVSDNSARHHALTCVPEALARAALPDDAGPQRQAYVPLLLVLSSRSSRGRLARRSSNSLGTGASVTEIAPRPRWP
jgi:hypothetical protein